MSADPAIRDALIWALKKPRDVTTQINVYTDSQAVVPARTIYARTCAFKRPHWHNNCRHQQTAAHGSRYSYARGVGRGPSGVLDNEAAHAAASEIVKLPTAAAT